MNNQAAQIEKILKNLKNDKEIGPTAAFRTNARIRILNTVANAKTTPLPLRRRPIIYAFRLGFLSLFLLAGTVYAAQTSQPRDVLFPVKILSERVALTLSPTETVKTSVAATIIGRRADETEHAKKDGDPEELQETITNFESAVSQIRKTSRIDHDRLEEEIERHAALIREEGDAHDDEDDKEDSRPDVKGEQTEPPSPGKSEDTRSVTPTPTKKDEQKDEERSSSNEDGSNHDANDIPDDD